LVQPARIPNRKDACPLFLPFFSRDLTSFSAQLGQFETGQFNRHPDRTPIIKGPIDPEAGLDKVWRLVWPSAGY
jgi:hypothetical protein